MVDLYQKIQQTKIMSSEISLKYLHPSVKTYITTENYSYDTSVAGETLCICDVFEKGVDNKLNFITNVNEYLFKYGNPNLEKFGQGGYNVERWLNSGGSAYVMRLLPDNASFAHAVVNIQTKNQTNGKTVIDSNDNETKIDDVYLRPLVTYIGKNNTSEALLESELTEDRSNYKTTDGFEDNFIFAVYPEGRGEYYNNIGFRIRLNDTYDAIMTSRVYTFDVIKLANDGTTFDIIEGPYYVSFDPDAFDPNSRKSMYIENVVNLYSQYVKVNCNDVNFIKVASMINKEVDPYRVDIFTGKSRILEDGTTETYLSSTTNQNEDIHISLWSFSTDGVALTNNGERILNIIDNADTYSDIVNIADNARITTFNNQKFAIEYMKSFYNMLLRNIMTVNLKKVLDGNILSNIESAKGLIIDKANDLIYNNLTNNDVYSYIYNGETKTSLVGDDQNINGSWYVKAMEVLNPSGSVGSLNDTEMASIITNDGYVSSTDEHLISYYNNFKKYFQFVANFDIYNSTPFVYGSNYTPIPPRSQSPGEVEFFRYDGTNYIQLIGSVTGSTVTLEKTNPSTSYSPEGLVYLPALYPTSDSLNDEVVDIITTDSSGGGVRKFLNAFLFNDETGLYEPNIFDGKVYNANDILDINGDYVKYATYEQSLDSSYTPTLMKYTNILVFIPNEGDFESFVIDFTEYITELYPYIPSDVDTTQTISFNVNPVGAINALILKNLVDIVNNNGYGYFPVKYTNLSGTVSIVNVDAIDIYRIIAKYLTEKGKFVSLGRLFAKKKVVDGSTTTYEPIKFGNLSADKYLFDDGDDSISELFNTYSDPSSLNMVYNKLYSYAGLISRELDGLGKDTIQNLPDISTKNLDSSNYSLTTLFNYIVGGFEAIVNNMGSVSDYSSYTSLKYLIKQIESDLDLRSTYLTLINVHKNTILDTSTDMAGKNASIILGDETLTDIYNYINTLVSETNYLITNIFGTVLSNEYEIYKISELNRVDNGNTFAFYFYNEGQLTPTPGEGDPRIIGNVDPIGINLGTYTNGNIRKLSDLGSTLDSYADGGFHGILPVLESILISLTGKNHYGNTRLTRDGSQSLVELYSDIRDGYTVNGLDQIAYEKFYNTLMDAIDKLSSIYSIASAFINEKYITDIIDNLIGELNINELSVSYDGKSYTALDLIEIVETSDPSESGIDISAEEIINEIAPRVVPDVAGGIIPYVADINQPIISYPYFVIDNILTSIDLAKQNKDIVKSNIEKQNNILVGLNTLCYDNVMQDISSQIILAEGSDGDFTYDNSTQAAIKTRMNKINDIRIKAYKGTWNEDIINTDQFEFDHILDAGYDNTVKNAIVSLARDTRQDFFFWGDTKIQNTVQDTLDWKDGFTAQTYFMSCISQSERWYDEYTSKNINLTSTYILSRMIPYNASQYGLQYPIAGSRRGVVDGFDAVDWFPNEVQKENLYKKKVNYLEKDGGIIRIGSQNTNYPSGPLGSINNMLVLLKIKRRVEKIARTYQFEQNTNKTRTAMETEINQWLMSWISNGACTVATASVYVNDYDIEQKIVRVDVELQFTGIIERILINIDCPAK